MDWQPEIVYAVLGAVVTGVLGWIVRGLRVKPQMKVLKMQEEQRERTWLRADGVLSRVLTPYPLRELEI